MKERGIRVLGVDPGTRVAGYGLLEVGAGGRPRLVSCGAIRLPGASMPQRLRVLHEELVRVIHDYRPGVLSVETVFHGKSFQSVLKVGEARGVVLLAGAANGLEVEEFPPALVKKAVTGSGRASKAQVQRLMGRLLELDPVPEPADVTDALALAYCYIRRAWRRRLEPARGQEILRKSAAAK